ncbi:hypothetical protein CFC21_073184 [Triticum aestivum]|uniref:Uncharacterized protein n=2 Tax=Triticum aestivum TaxID=4565 RepID=A0A3B6LQR5_WHEAT|nr:hypothetical protein CFC21_073184 [Triticum aestivum]
MDGGVAAAASVSKKRKQWLNNQDLISDLPDEILDIIISRLPTKPAARTAVLSSRWRHLWRSAPLNLAVDRRLSGWECDRIAIVSKILAAHAGPVCRLSLHGIICLRRGIYRKIDRWFRSPTLDGLEELDFTSNGSYYGDGDGGDRPPRPLPPSALRFAIAPTLRAVNIDSCDFPEIDAAPALLFPRLKQLKLYKVAISQAAIHRLLSGCIALESLELESTHGLNTVQIVSPTLRSIVVSVSYHNRANVMLQKLVVEDAPCLERLIPRGDGPNIIKVISASKLAVEYLSSKT